MQRCWVGPIQRELVKLGRVRLLILRIDVDHRTNDTSSNGAEQYSPARRLWHGVVAQACCALRRGVPARAPTPTYLPDDHCGRGHDSRRDFERGQKRRDHLFGGGGRERSPVWDAVIHSAGGQPSVTGSREHRTHRNSQLQVLSWLHREIPVRIAPGTYRLLAQDPARVAGGKLTCLVRDARIHDASGGSHIQRFPSKLTVPTNGAMSLDIGCFNSVG
jgi:hypothetical protein